MSTFDRLAKKLTNTQAGNPRKGQTFRTVVRNGQAFHKYLSPGGGGEIVKVGSPKAQPSGTTNRPAMKLNTQAGNARQGSMYASRDLGNGRVAHTYAAQAGGIPRETYVVKKKKA